MIIVEILTLTSHLSAFPLTLIAVFRLSKYHFSNSCLLTSKVLPLVFITGTEMYFARAMNLVFYPESFKDIAIFVDQLAISFLHSIDGELTLEHGAIRQVNKIGFLLTSFLLDKLRCLFYTSILIVGTLLSLDLIPDK